ncbi:diguanylate cyclase [Calditerrivibrio sp.]|uniref:diguanylate cyclase n=1 Tax=Calditerrivibrio sp. TaxID=2792612 RepID=UPI003D10808B
MNSNNEHKGKILIIDDSVSNIQLINGVLKDDYEIFFSTNGVSGIKKVYEISPDLILLDVVMPDMDGYEVLTKLKSDLLTREIPVIFITALDSVEQEVKGLEAGAVDYITKPIIGAILKARVATHIELKRQRDYLKNLAMIDGLTGIANKRRFNEYLEKWYKISLRKKMYLSIFVIDIDYFKLYNDTYGHLAGDDCLKSIACAIKDSLKRPYDLVARFGGEEFACVIPETSYDDALMIAGRIKSNISNLRLEHKASTISPYVTVSIGGVCGIPTEMDEHFKMLERADEALYKAKQFGRNQIVIEKI